MSLFLPDARLEVPELLTPYRFPVGAMTVDTNHPLASGLRGCFLMQPRYTAGSMGDLAEVEHRVQNLVPNVRGLRIRQDSNTISGGDGIGFEAYGHTFNDHTTGVSEDRCYQAVAADLGMDSFEESSALVICELYRDATTGSNRDISLTSCDLVATSVDQPLFVNNSDTYGQVQAFQTSGQGRLNPGINLPQAKAGEVHAFMYTHSRDASFRHDLFYSDPFGQIQSGGGARNFGSGSAEFYGTGDLVFAPTQGNNGPDNKNFNGRMYAIMVWNRKLTNAEALEVIKHPYQMLQPANGMLSNLLLEQETALPEDLTLTFDNVVMDPLASIHVQWMSATGTLTVVNTNGSNLSIGSAPNGGTIVFVTPATLTVSDLEPNTEVRYYEAGTATELAGVENSGTSFSAQVQVNSVDIVLISLDYEIKRVEGVDTSGGDVTVVAGQFFDRNYDNPV